jgi:hypothetical protein
MKNGHDASPAPIQVNPQQAAAYALQFLADVAHTRAQREAYDIAVAMLQAIVNGHVILSSPPASPAAEPQPETQQ